MDRWMDGRIKIGTKNFGGRAMERKKGVDRFVWRRG